MAVTDHGRREAAADGPAGGDQCSHPRCAIHTGDQRNHMRALSRPKLKLLTDSEEGGVLSRLTAKNIKYFPSEAQI